MYDAGEAIVGSRGGYRLIYRMEERNRCPGCGQAQWIVGRTTAECAFCGTALPLEDSRSGTGVFHTRGRGDVAAALAA